MKSKYVVSLFVASSMLFLSGCDSTNNDNFANLGEDEYELCYDTDNNGYCDDTWEQIDRNSYLHINGKQEAYVKYDSYNSSSSGG
jgi:hypothetical protein